MAVASGCVWMWSVVVLALFIVMILLIHHKYTHSNPLDKEHFLQDPCDQWFQCGIYPKGDVCNFATCSHEMWIIALLLLCGCLVVVLHSQACAPFS